MGQPAAKTSPIPIRRPFFSYVREGRHFDTPYAEDAGLSAFWGVLSLAFPEGEKFFVDSVKRYSHRLSDALRKDVVGFAGQESMHAKEHLTFNARILPPQAEKAIRWSHRRVDALLHLGRTRMSGRMQLAVTCALEHFTATLAEQLLTLPEHRDAIDPEVRGMWLWHALEELEHKSVAFDVYEEVGGTYSVRVVAMVLATFFLCEYLGEATARVLYAQGKLRPKHLRALYRSLMKYPGLVPRLMPKYLDYYRRDFHPTDHDTTELLAHWRAALFDDQNGILRDAMKPPLREVA